MAEHALADVCERVTVVVLDSLDIQDERECSLATNLMRDLEAESLDFLDIVFRLEKAFGVKIERGRIENTLRKRFPDLTIKPNTSVTAELRAVFAELLPEVQADEIDGLQRVKDAAKTFRIATFVRLVVEALHEAGSVVRCAQPMQGYSPAQLGVAVVG